MLLRLFSFISLIDRIFMLLIFSICSGRELSKAIPLLSLLRRISLIRGGKGLRWGFGIFGVLVMEIGSSYKINNKT